MTLRPERFSRRKAGLHHNERNIVMPLHMRAKRFAPWWFKIAAKLFLARLPANYSFWKRIHIFEHGRMERPEYALGIFEEHFNLVKPPPGFVMVELGPGDSLYSALIAKAYGASASFLIDAGNFANQDLQGYFRMARFLADKGFKLPKLDGATSVQDILKAVDATSLTSGLTSLKTLPDRSVDFVWSHAVLEHIRKREFGGTMEEVSRILKARGGSSHVVDLKDHLGGALNNLRLSAEFWEADWVAESGFYTNRIRFKEMLDYFRHARLVPDVIKMDKWDKLPTPRNRLRGSFRDLSEDELLISGFTVLLTADSASG